MAEKISFRVAAAFAALFFAYQLPEGIGQRLLGSFPAQAALLLFFFAVAYIIGRRYSRNVLRAYALDNPARFWRPTVHLFVLAVILKLLTVAMGAGLGVFHKEQNSATFTAALTSLGFSLLLTFAPSIAEDIVTRGFWFERCGRSWRPAIFVIATSIIYVLNHVFRLTAGPAEWIMLFTFGVAYSLAVVRFRSLWPAVGLHWGWNYGNAVVAAFWPYTVTSPTAGRALAIAAHLIMAALVITRLRRT